MKCLAINVWLLMCACCTETWLHCRENSTTRCNSQQQWRNWAVMQNRRIYINVHAWWPVKRQASKEVSLPAKHSCCALISLSCSMMLLVDGGLWWTSKTAIRLFMFVSVLIWVDGLTKSSSTVYMIVCVAIYVFVYFIIWLYMPCGHNFSTYAHLCAWH